MAYSKTEHIVGSFFMFWLRSACIFPISLGIGVNLAIQGGSTPISKTYIPLEWVALEPSVHCFRVVYGSKTRIMRLDIAEKQTSGAFLVLSWKRICFHWITTISKCFSCSFQMHIYATNDSSRFLLFSWRQKTRPV